MGVFHGGLPGLPVGLGCWVGGRLASFGLSALMEFVAEERVEGRCKLALGIADVASLEQRYGRRCRLVATHLSVASRQCPPEGVELAHDGGVFHASARP